MNFIERIISCGMSRLGCVSLWGKKGPDVFDCSGLVSWSCVQAGFVSPLNPSGGRRWDPLLNWNAQRMANDLENYVDRKEAKRGDLCFYGRGWHNVTHVTIFLGYEGVLSASGATSMQQSLAIAKMNPRARVRVHDSVAYRKDYIGFGRIDGYLKHMKEPVLV